MGLGLLGIPTSVVYSPILISFYGTWLSNGVIALSELCAYIFGTGYFRKDIVVKEDKNVVPLSFIGVACAAYFGRYISAYWAEKFVAVVVLFSSFLYFNAKYSEKLSKMGWFFGIIGGFSSYLVNVSSPLFNIYFLSFHKSKQSFLGTRNLFYTALDFLKVVLYFIILKNIGWDTIRVVALTIPGMLFGFFGGRLVLKHIDKAIFERFIVIASILIALKLLFF
jgi:hypothetical protein